MLRRLVDVRKGELSLVLLSFAYFFFLLAGYYILRPLRDEMGIRGGVDNLEWMFTGTFVAMLVAVPAYGWVVARHPRRTAVPVVYRFFLLNLLAFFVLLQLGVAPEITAQAFFIWTSVFNLFVVSVFWSVMADVWSHEEGKRLFGFIAAGGTVGGLVGPVITAVLAQVMSPVLLLLVAAAFLEAAAQCAIRVGRRVNPEAPAHEAEALGGNVLAGLAQVVRSPYLAGICVYILLLTTTSTFLYFEQQHIVAAQVEGSGDRTSLFASMDFVVNALTLALQAFVTGPLMARLGVGAVLATLPVLTAAGFGALAFAPTVALVFVFQGVRRAVNFAVARPAREVLFTVVSREEKYKAKSVIDTVVYRGGDAVAGWVFAGFRGLGMSLSAIAMTAIPISLAWWGVAAALGRRQDRLEKERS